MSIQHHSITPPIYLRFILLAVMLATAPAAVADVVVPSSRVTSYLIVRTAPDTASQKITRLAPGQSGVLLESLDRWYKISLPDGSQGYVSKAWSALHSDFRLGAWNIKKLGHGTNKDYGKVARIIEAHFDLLAVVEVMQKSRSHPGYEALMQALGAGWSGLITAAPRPNTNVGDAEFYAIVYRRSATRPCSDQEQLTYVQDNDGASSSGTDRFVREPAFACFETIAGAGRKGWDFLLAAYHATWADGDEDLILEEASHLPDVFANMQASRAGERDLFIVGDFNLTSSVLADVTPASDRTADTGSTLNSKGELTRNQYDHLLVLDSEATSELTQIARAIDVRDQVATRKRFYQTVSDHLPIVARFRKDVPDDD